MAEGLEEMWPGHLLSGFSQFCLLTEPFLWYESNKICA